MRASHRHWSAVLLCFASTGVLSAEEKLAIYSGTAKRVYRLEW